MKVRHLFRRLATKATVRACYKACDAGSVLHREPKDHGFHSDVVAQSPTYHPAAEALCCFRGIEALTVMTILCEVGDPRRFESPRQLAAYLGLVPSERSSGAVQRRGPITKAGNTYAGQLLV